MDDFWGTIIDAGVIVLGVAASTWLGVLSQTGPRRRVENIKVATEALAQRDDLEAVEDFIARESYLLRRQLDPVVRARRGVAVYFAAIALAALVISWLLSLLELAAGWNWQMYFAGLIFGVVGGIGGIVVKYGLQHRYRQQLVSASRAEAAPETEAT